MTKREFVGFVDFLAFVAFVELLEIATPRQVGARNNTEGYYPTLQTDIVSPIYLNWKQRLRG